MDKEQVARNLDRMEAKEMVKTQDRPRLTSPEINDRLNKLTISSPVSLTVCEMLGVTKRYGLEGAPISLILEIVKKHVGTTKGLTAAEWECAQASRLLSVPRGLARQAFSGRPLRQLLEISRWLLSHQHEEDFDVPEKLGGWTLEQERKEWANSVRDRAAAGCDVSVAIEPIVLDGLREME